VSTLVDVIGTPVVAAFGLTSDAVVSTVFSGVSVQGLGGILFLAFNDATIPEGETGSFQVQYSTNALASDAATSNAAIAHSCTDAVISFSTALGLTVYSVRSLWLDISAKGWTEGSVHGALTGEAADHIAVIAIPVPATATLPRMTATYVADD